MADSSATATPPWFHVAGSAGPLVGAHDVPGDKSIGHRAVMFAALASGRSRIDGLSGGEDNLRTVAAFRALGVSITEASTEAGARGRSLIVDGVGLDGLTAPASPVDCGNSGTSMRLLCGVLASARFATTLVGDEYLHRRPMGRVAEPLIVMGARITGQPGKKLGDIYPALVVGPAPGRLRGIEYPSPIASAQVKTAVLLAALSADGATLFTEPGPSRDHTERMLAGMGAPLHVAPDRVVVTPHGWNRVLRARDVLVPGDLSSAAFLLGAALLVPGSEVTVRNVCINPTRTGVLDALLHMGAQLHIERHAPPPGVAESECEPVADITAWGSRLSGTTIAGSLSVRALDELPLLAALAAHAEGTTVIRDAGELRVKESDRIAAMCAALTAMGVRVEETLDGMVVHGGMVRGGMVASHGDHRIAMASAVCGLAATGATRVEDVANVATSFPQFITALRKLGAAIDPH